MTQIAFKRPLSVMLVCGEPSGDQLGAQLMRSLRVLSPDIRFSGVGGTAMAAEGMQSLFSLNDTAVMGLREVVPKIPMILCRVKQASDFALRSWPDAVVLIDSPDFTHRIARRIKRINPAIITVNYVAPQVWASRAYRAKAMAGYFDLVLALLPFETSFFENYKLRTIFVGHPVLERAPAMRGGAELRARLGIGAETKLLAVLPGSRTNEIRFILPVFRKAVALLAAKIPELVTILPTVPHVAARVQEGARDWPTPLHIVEGEGDKFAAFDAADAALAASGTVTTELALSRTPMVTAYKVGALTYALARPLFRLRYFTLVNLLLDREAVPEFLQSRASPQNLANALLPLLTDAQAAKGQIADLEKATQLLGEGGAAPSLRAAQALLDFLHEKKREASI